MDESLGLNNTDHVAGKNRVEMKSSIRPLLPEMLPRREVQKFSPRGGEGISKLLSPKRLVIDRHVAAFAGDGNEYPETRNSSKGGPLKTFLGVLSLIGGFASALLGLVGAWPALLAVSLTHFLFGGGLGMLQAPWWLGLLAAAMPLVAVGMTPMALVASGIGLASYVIGKFASR